MHLNPRTILLVVAMFAFVVPAVGQTITVTTGLIDTVDVPPNATINDLPGPDGVVCLREAFLVSDNMPGTQTIAFQVPTDQWYLRNIFPEFCCLYGRFGVSCDDTVIVDGTTQTAFTGDTNPDGWEIVMYGVQMGVAGTGSEVFGIHATDLSIDGSNVLVHDNTGDMYIRSYFNTGTRIYDNEGDTIQLYGTHDNVVVRNTITRVRITGNGSADPATNNIIGGPDPSDRNFITGWGNVGEHGSPAGTTIELYSTTGTRILNNYIGTTPDGMSIGNRASTVGVGVFSDNIDLTVRDNLIAISARWGGGETGPPRGAAVYIEAYDNSSGIDILNNTIGLNAAGEPVLGAENGVWVSRYAFQYADNIRIMDNIIAGHGVSGVLCVNGPGINPSAGVRISGNSIYDNGEIGIDLTANTWDFGPTPNDKFDYDVGANGLQNYPELTSATLAGSSLQISGTIHTERSRDYTIEFFASPACDPSGFGQGEVFLGSKSVTTDSSGNAGFNAALIVQNIPLGWVVTSTATREANNATSEFSACTPITKAVTGPRGQRFIWDPFPHRRP